MTSAAIAAVEKVGPVVIGAGVIGLAVARAVSARLKAAAAWDGVLILERHDSVGRETSSRNSEVVHGGLYYPHDSHKARLCVQGRRLLYDYADSRGVDYVKTGKFVVATEADHAATLVGLHRQAALAGYDSTRLLTAQSLWESEPHVVAYNGDGDDVAALWSPETGIVDSHGLMTSLLADAQEQGAVLAVQSTVEEGRIVKKENSNSINNNSKSATTTMIQLNVGGTWIASDCVVNCAGLWADRVARLIHNNNHNNCDDNDNNTSSSHNKSRNNPLQGEETSSASWSPPRQYFARGNYFSLSGVRASQIPFSHLIYPVPDRRGGLGVHATLDRTGSRVKFGPDVEWLAPDVAIPEYDGKDDHDDAVLDFYAPNVRRVSAFYESIRRYWPDLPDGALQPDYVGVRPKLL